MVIKLPLYQYCNITKKSTATTNKRCGFESSVFIKINATWINKLLSFVARYFGVEQNRYRGSFRASSHNLAFI